MKPCVYILQSKRTEKFYIGTTTNLQQRLKHHLRGATPSTFRLGEVQLVLSQEYNSLAEARSIERKLKSLKRHDYIEKIVRDGHIKIGP
ncbi:GIY-YIG nuclease family protein [Candidatus Berkelbacteria bacterium]|nr:GIY-YIG nuclease family protein [Candidatus Berkelbacteria bacterium]